MWPVIWHILLTTPVNKEILSPPRKGLYYSMVFSALSLSKMKLTSVMCFTLDSYFQICWIKISYKWLKCYNKWFKPLGIRGKQFNGVPKQLQDKEIWVMNSSSILMWGLHPGVPLCVLSTPLSKDLLVFSVVRADTTWLCFSVALCQKKQCICHIGTTCVHMYY